MAVRSFGQGRYQAAEAQLLAKGMELPRTSMRGRLANDLFVCGSRLYNWHKRRRDGSIFLSEAYAGRSAEVCHWEVSFERSGSTVKPCFLIWTALEKISSSSIDVGERLLPLGSGSIRSSSLLLTLYASYSIVYTVVTDPDSPNFDLEKLLNSLDH